MQKTYIILFAIFASVILYLAGVFSGLYANKILKEATEKDISILKEKTSKDLVALQSYVDFLDVNLKSMQLEQTFRETLASEQMCSFSRISFNELLSQLGYYWDRLPYRIEEYEKYNKLSEDYKLLKQQYAHLSIRTWILARNQYEKCSMNVTHGLYFYSADCKECVEQGEQLDKLNLKARASGKEMVMFPIDFYMGEPIASNLKKYYGINSSPAIIINDNVLQGRLFTAEELFSAQNTAGAGK